MSGSGAIETTYRGYRFRSRLEARWAVFFDALGIRYQYEPEGYEKDLGSGEVIRYLPDFFLPDSKTWVEVKGSDDALLAEADRMERFLDFGCPLPGFTDSALVRPTHDNFPGLIFLGEVPHVVGTAFHPMVRHHEGLEWGWITFVPGEPTRVCFPISIGNDPLLWRFLALTRNPEPWSCQAEVRATPGYWGRVEGAYAAARGARFEHGEMP